MITAAALTFLVNTAGAILNWTDHKFGRLGTQIILFACALLAALFVHFDFFTPGIKTYFVTALGIFSAAVTLYEVLLSRFPLFAGPQ